MVNKGSPRQAASKGAGKKGDAKEQNEAAGGVRGAAGDPGADVWGLAIEE